MITLASALTTISPLILLTLTPPTTAAAVSSSRGFGTAPAGANATLAELFRNRTSTTPHSASVPFHLSDGSSFRLQVNTSTIDGMGFTTSAVFTQYSLVWDDEDPDLNATLREAQGVEQPRLCATIPLGQFFSPQVTNAYDEDEPGSCAGPLGRKCFDALTEAGFGGAVGDCPAPILPEECEGKFPDGGLGTASVLTNETQSSPAPFAFYNTVVPSYGTSQGNAEEAAEERLHMVIFAGQHSYSPVCIRPQATKVSKGDPSVSGAGRWRSWGVGAVLGLAGMFMWL